jgi:hypothetical protein
MSALTLTARRPGRVALEDDPARRARNFRWFVASTLGFPAEAIAAGEPEALHARTVRRGVAAARTEVADQVARADFDFAPSLALKNSTRRRCGRAPGTSTP